MFGSSDPAPLRKYDHRDSGQEREENERGAIEQFVLAQQRETDNHRKNYECESWHRKQSSPRSNKQQRDHGINCVTRTQPKTAEDHQRNQRQREKQFERAVEP